MSIPRPDAVSEQLKFLLSENAGPMGIRKGLVAAPEYWFAGLSGWSATALSQ